MTRISIRITTTPINNKRGTRRISKRAIEKAI
jgi:hypothetical protein